MLQQQISLNPDLKRLRDEGYEIQVMGGYLIIHHIPYVNKEKEIKLGKLIVALTLNGYTVMKPTTHVISFMGEYPCNKDGTTIESIRHSSYTKSDIGNNIEINYTFSNKPQNGYNDHYEQVVRYVDIISAPAKSLDRNITANTYVVIESDSEDDCFQYTNTHESRSNIVNLNNKFREQKIAIIGLGGTGSYVLDFVSKTPVSEIHLFDGDLFQQHNAFRCPGAPSKKVINLCQNKVKYYSDLYGNMHKRVIPHCEYITEDNIDFLLQMSWVFICVDSNKIRNIIIKKLVNMNISFIDVGLGVNVVDNTLIGMLRTTTGTPFEYEHIVKRISLEDNDDNEYSTNIQIADLNALNALHAIIKWKKQSGFYQDLINEYHSTYSINNSLLLNEDCKI